MSGDSYKRSRLRKAGRLPPVPTCPTCGKRVISDKHGGLCSRCWITDTPEGRRQHYEWAYASTKRRKARQGSALRDNNPPQSSTP